MSDGFFFLSVFFFFFAAWLAGGGPNKPISFAGPYITPITNVGVRQTGYGGPLNFNTSTGISSARSNLFTIQSSVDDLGKQVSDAKLFGTPSPRKGQVTIGWGSSVGASDPKQEYVSIRVVHDAPQNIDITGWRLQSVSSDYSATIPQGTELLSGTGNNAKADIILHPDDVAYIISGESPVDTSFHENECMGYYTQSQNFYPSLSNQCPSPQSEYTKHYTGNTYKDDGCYTLVQSLNSCTVPPESSRLSSSCFTFIDTYLNYQGCVANHRGDQNFWDGSWHIYLNRMPITKNHSDERIYGDLWKPTHDAIRLLDANGQTVDLYKY
jgi:hypothetical protein